MRGLMDSYPRFGESLDRLERAREEIEAQQERLAVIRDELQAERFVSEGYQGNVRVTVSGTGALIDVELIEGALEGPHLRTLGDEVVQALQAARQRAAERGSDRLAGVVADPAAVVE